MKKILNTIILIFFISWQGIAQEVVVPQSQVPLIIKIAASWCPPCGGWGWTFFDEIYEDHSDEAIFMSVHHSGDHTNTDAQAMTQNFNIFSQPRYLFNGIDQNVSSSNTAEKRNDFMQLVEEEIGLSPMIQTGLEASYWEDQINVQYAVEIFDELEGEYYLGLYLVEKLHVGYQASIGPDAGHKDLIRKELSGNSFGTLLFAGTGSIGDRYEGSIQTELDGYNPENINIVSIIWKKTGAQYEVMNTNMDDDVQADIPSAVKDTQTQYKLQVFPTVIEDRAQIQLDLNQTLEMLSLELIDASGKRIQQLYHGRMQSGLHRINWTPSVPMVAGPAYLLATDGESRQSIKIFFK